jgi:hypothetical protein
VRLLALLYITTHIQTNYDFSYYLYNYIDMYPLLIRYTITEINNNNIYHQVIEHRLLNNYICILKILIIPFS